MHIGSECTKFDTADDDSSCDHKTELYSVLKDLAPGTLDVIIAGHTHAAIAHKINGVAVIESLSQGRAFGRVDLTITGGKLAGVKVFPPQLMCPLDEHKNAVPIADCHPDPYEGKPVVADAAVQKIADAALDRAGVKRAEKLGVTLAAAVTKAYREESAEGDWFTELMLAAQPGTDIAMTNGGGLRADLPAGELTYGAFFEAIPFDNRFAIVDLSGAQLRDLVYRNLHGGGGFMSWGGLAAVAKCTNDKLVVDVKVAGKPIDDKKTYKLVTSDFLVSGGDAALKHLKLADTAIHATDVIMRDGMADVLRARKGTPAATIDPAKIMAHRRLDYTGKRPVRCKNDQPAEHDGDD
jgi:5'-nucleotidase